MKLSLNWLKDYVDHGLSPDELIHRLTMAGLEVEGTAVVDGDTVLELEITPNRPDALSILGLAREVSAITGKALKSPHAGTAFKSTKKAKLAPVFVHIENKKDCPRYIGTLIRNVRIGPAPQALARRIHSMGLKQINNAVDITNFVLMEMGQPLHAFDYDKLAGGKIIVRRAHAGEAIVTLDGIERKLDPSILVIADAKKPVAIAGIMGGLGTEITASTKNILLESAQFDMGLIRRASRALGLKSDSSYRFERGVDAQGVLTGANRAVDLLLHATQGICAARADAGEALKLKPKPIAISVDAIEGLLGSKVSGLQVKGILTRLGMSVKTGKKNQFTVTAPSFRVDLKQPVDLIEETARIIGYDRLDVSFPAIKAGNIAPASGLREVKNSITQALLTNGYSEAITYALISKSDLDKSGLPHDQAIALHNALSQEHMFLRRSMLPSLLKIAVTNINRGQKNLRLFEIGKRYLSGKEGERLTLGILATGRRQQDWRDNDKEPMDIYDLKGALQQVFSRLNVTVEFGPCEWLVLDPACAAQFHLKGESIGLMGRVQTDIARNWDIKNQDIYFASVDVQALQEMPALRRHYEPVPEFPAIVRDVSLAVKTDIAYAQIEAACRDLGGNILHHVHLIEEYTGDKIQSGYRGLVISLQYQSHQRTLREEEVNQVHHKILAALTQQIGALQR